MIIMTLMITNIIIGKAPGGNHAQVIIIILMSNIRPLSHVIVIIQLILEEYFSCQGIRGLEVNIFL